MKARWLYFLVLTMTLGVASPSRAEDVVGVSEFAHLVELYAKVSGVISDVSVEAGAVVKDGDVLVRLDDRLQRARFQTAEVAAKAVGPVLRAEAQLEVARERHARLRRAASRGGAPSWEVTEAEGAVLVAEANLRAAQEEAEANRARRDFEAVALLDFVVSAPFDGIIVETDAEKGALASGDRPLAVLADPSEITVSVFVPVERAIGLAPGNSLPAYIGSPFDRQIEVVLKSVEPRIEPSSRTMRVFFSYENVLNDPAGLEIRIFLPDDSQ
jgi:membrane fusion protein (multidrug efflux system)